MMLLCRWSDFSLYNNFESYGMFTHTTCVRMTRIGCSARCKVATCACERTLVLDLKGCPKSELLWGLAASFRQAEIRLKHLKKFQEEQLSLFVFSFSAVMCANHSACTAAIGVRSWFKCSTMIQLWYDIPVQQGQMQVQDTKAERQARESPVITISV